MKRTSDKSRFLGKATETLRKMRQPQERIQIIHNFQQQRLLKLINAKYLISGTIALYSLYLMTAARKHEQTKFSMSLSRRASQVTGFLTSCTLPPYLRKYIYLGFGKLYGVNFDEIKADDLNSFRTFNLFFTREIKEGARTIINQHDPNTLCSPCDGRVLSFGQVNELSSTIDCVKGNDYRLDEFLFGYKIKESQSGEKQNTMIEGIIKSAKERGNKVLYTVIYLAPYDYHRYHSPAHFTANYRRHIAGYLEPVRPDYILKHKDVLKDNERVTLLGEWTHGFFTMSFIGALNVGSIKLLFDDELITNAKRPQLPYFVDRNYQTLLDRQGEYLSFPYRQGQGQSPLEFKKEDIQIGKYLNEFDIKDIIDISEKKTHYEYLPSLEHRLPFNILNSFRQSDSLGQDNINKESRELLSKLESPIDASGQAVKRFTITPQGVLLRKGEEMGMFEMGSTIALIFECPKDYEFKFKEGEKVVLGQEIVSRVLGSEQQVEK